jgi:hypothetical protein
MKKLIFICLITILSIHQVHSQQWIDKKYDYDSILNVTYGSALNFNGEVDSLHMDIYLPDCDDATHTSKRPLLMWIHGGSFIAGSKDDVSIQAMCKSFAKRGYVTASIDYRLGFVSDEGNWQCNYPNYSCVFATDSSEWARSYYRSIQDGKGALRYLINRHQEFRIDTNNVFVAGESAGSFVALGIGLLDTISERPLETYAISDAPTPHSNSLNCGHNQVVNFTGNAIPRPDLGGIDGTIEPSNINYTIKGIGNMFGGMMTNLLEDIPVNKTKPAIYSFHQPCDIIVPIDSNYVYWGLSWCFTHGYNCYGIANNKKMLYGSRTFSEWNTDNGLGYEIQNEFTSVNFPYSFIIGQASCTDQVNNPCHAYDNKLLRETNLATFFSDKITTNPICDTAFATSISEVNLTDINVYPNPANNLINIKGSHLKNIETLVLYDPVGSVVLHQKEISKNEITIDISSFPIGMYILELKSKNGIKKSIKIVKK